MTTEQVSQLKVLFLEAWNNVEIASTELHTYLTAKAQEAGLLAPNVEFTKEATRTSFATLGNEYTNYRTRPRKAKTDFVVDFGGLENDSVVTEEQKIQVETAEPLSDESAIGDEDELDSEVVTDNEPREEEVQVNVPDTVKSNFNW